ncbi:MAG TPA: helix-turn-helix domain-containing protein [Sphingomicrobium sp.]
MPKREPDPEPLQEEPLEPVLAPAGERLRIAREAKGLSLEDVASQTRIPRRHLENIEKADWDSLPAPTYTIGFAKSYASAVDLDRTEIGDQLRDEMGGQRFANTSADVFEPADPRRTMPKGIVLGAILAVVVLIALMSWLNQRSLEDTGTQDNAAVTQNQSPAPATSAPPAEAPAPAAAAQGPVVLTATDPVWLQVSEKGGATIYSGTLQPNQTYTVPQTAKAPVLKTGKPEALKVTVGTAAAPPVGAPATTVSNVSLLPADLMKAPQSGTSATPVTNNAQ